MAWVIPCSRNPHFRKWSFDARNSGFIHPGQSFVGQVRLQWWEEKTGELGGIIYSGRSKRATRRPRKSKKFQFLHPRRNGTCSVAP